MFFKRCAANLQRFSNYRIWQASVAEATSALPYRARVFRPRIRIALTVNAERILRREATRKGFRAKQGQLALSCGIGQGRLGLPTAGPRIDTARQASRR